MLTLALSFTRHTSLRMKEFAGVALALGGALTFLGTSVPFGRRGGHALGGLLVCAAGVLFFLSYRYGV
jgi:hypothetical protein